MNIEKEIEQAVEDVIYRLNPDLEEISEGYLSGLVRCRVGPVILGFEYCNRYSNRYLKLKFFVTKEKHFWWYRDCAIYLEEPVELSEKTLDYIISYKKQKDEGAKETRKGRDVERLRKLLDVLKTL